MGDSDKALVNLLSEINLPLMLLVHNIYVLVELQDMSFFHKSPVNSFLVLVNVFLKEGWSILIKEY